MCFSKKKYGIYITNAFSLEQMHLSIFFFRNQRPLFTVSKSWQSLPIQLNFGFLGKLKELYNQYRNKKWLVLCLLTFYESCSRDVLPEYIERQRKHFIDTNSSVKIICKAESEGDSLCNLADIFIETLMYDFRQQHQSSGITVTFWVRNPGISRCSS